MSFFDLTPKQRLRNELATIEDKARALRNGASTTETYAICELVSRLAQIVRERVVK